MKQFTTQDDMVKTLDTVNIFDLLHKAARVAADLYADGDISRIQISSNPSSGEIEVYAKGELIKRPDFEAITEF